MIKRYIAKLLDINDNTFSYTVAIFIITILIEQINKGIISRYINIKLFFAIVIILGLVHLISSGIVSTKQKLRSI
jgi:uncharacterized membrane protein